MPNTRFWAESAGGGDAAVRPALPGAEAGGLPKPDGLPPSGPRSPDFAWHELSRSGRNPAPHLLPKEGRKPATLWDRFVAGATCRLPSPAVPPQVRSKERGWGFACGRNYAHSAPT